MKTYILLATIIISLFFTGCVVYGEGEAEGFVYTVEDGSMWDKVSFKENLNDENKRCYLLDDEKVKEQLRMLPKGTKIKINYNKHLFTSSMCPEDEDTNNEITSFEIVGEYTGRRMDDYYD